MPTQTNKLHNYFFSGKYGYLDQKYNGSARVGQESAGNVFECYLQIDDNSIADAYFKAFGSVALIAAGEFICEQLRGKSLQVVNDMTADKLLVDLELPLTKIHVGSLIITAINGAIKDYHERSQSI